MLIGLTGEYCAGKNHIAKLLESRGFEVLDVDKLGHLAIEREKPRIVALFGEEILRSDGTIDRQRLGSQVFGMASRLASLEAIVHPAANALSEEWIAEREGKDLVINAALLHRCTAFDKLDFILLVKAPLLTRLLRARKRDHLPLLTLITRFRSQKHFEAQYFSRNADIQRVDNRGACALGAASRERALEEQLDSILAREGMVQQPWNRKSFYS